MSTDKKSSPSLVTGEFRVSFPAVFEPKAFQDQEPKYSVVMLFDKKKSDMSNLKNALVKACIDRWGPKEKWPKSVMQKWPLKDGDEKEDLQGYAGHFHATASAKQRPGVIDRDKSPITKEDESFYAGCYARAEVRAFTYPKEGVKGIAPGVSIALQNIQKLRDGEAFSGRRKAEDVFDAVEDSSESPDAYGTSSEDDWML